VDAVGFDVEEVVDDVGGGGAQAEAEEGDAGGGDEGRREGVGEEEGEEDEGVFGPLMQAEGFRPGLEGGGVMPARRSSETRPEVGLATIGCCEA